MEVQEDRVLICKDYNNRPNGEAFVELGDEEEVERSLEKHNQSMGHRWGDTDDEKSRGWALSFCYQTDMNQRCHRYVVTKTQFCRVGEGEIEITRFASSPLP